MSGRPAGGAFVGRSEDLAVLLDACGRAERGDGALALVRGEAGVGKSRLVAEAGAEARRRGARVLVGQCLDLEEGGVPYAPLRDMLRVLARDLGPDEGSATLGPLRAFLAREGDEAGDSPAEGVPAATAAPGTAGPTGQARLFELLLSVVERLVAAAPLVLVFEDLHWADRSTLDIFALLASGTRGLPVCTIGTYRTEDVPRGHPLRRLAAELTRRGARHVDVGRLGPGEVADLLGSLLGAPPAPAVTASVVERSDGNPLFVEELAAGLADDPTAPMPPHLRDAVISRVERMAPGPAAVLRACAVGGREVDHDVLAAVTADPLAGSTGRPPADALDADLRACVETGLLVADRDAGTYRFRHALVHEAVLGDVLPGEDRRLHAAYAAALDRRRGAERGRPAGELWSRLARHWAGAGDFDAGLAAAARAGRAAEASFAVPEAHRSLEWCVRLWDRAADPEAAAGCRRDELLASAADAANRCGSVERALTLVDEALASPTVADEPVRAGLLNERRGWYLQRSGRTADALDAHQAAVDLVPGRPSSAARARVVQAYAHALVRAGAPEAARPRAEEALAVARTVGDRVDEGQALHVLGLVLAAEGRTDDAVASLHAAGQIAVGLGDLAEVAGAYVHLWRTLVEAGRGEDVVGLLLAHEATPPARLDPAPPLDPPTDGRDRGGGPGGQRLRRSPPALVGPAPPVDPPEERVGRRSTPSTPSRSSAPARTSLTGCIGAAALRELGRWDDAEALLGDPAAAGEAGGLTAVTRTLVSGALAVDRGDHGRARDELETARAWCHQVGDGRLNGLLHRALAELAVWQGRYGDARRDVDSGLALLAHTGDLELAARIAAVGVRAEADAARAEARLARGPTAGADRRVVDLVGRLEAMAAAVEARRAPPANEVTAALATARAERTRVAGAGDPGAWVEAVAAWEAIGFPYAAAHSRLRLAEAALGAGDGATASDALTGAWDAARALGARPLADALAGLARRARVTLPGAAPTGAGPRRTAAPGGHAGAGGAGRTLTPRERDVLALVAAGRTNRQIGDELFISQKTASVHVSRLLSKLGAATRGEAAAVARRQGLLGDSDG